MQSPAHLDARGGELSSSHLWWESDEDTLDKMWEVGHGVIFWKMQLGIMELNRIQRKTRLVLLFSLEYCFAHTHVLGISAFNLQVYLLKWPHVSAASCVTLVSELFLTEHTAQGLINTHDFEFPVGSALRTICLFDQREFFQGLQGAHTFFRNRSITYTVNSTCGFYQSANTVIVQSFNKHSYGIHRGESRNSGQRGLLSS